MLVTHYACVMHVLCMRTHVFCHSQSCLELPTQPKKEDHCRQIAVVVKQAWRRKLDMYGALQPPLFPSPHKATEKKISLATIQPRQTLLNGSLVTIATDSLRSSCLSHGPSVTLFLAWNERIGLFKKMHVILLFKRQIKDLRWGHRWDASDLEQDTSCASLVTLEAEWVSH